MIVNFSVWVCVFGVFSFFFFSTFAFVICCFLLGVNEKIASSSSHAERACTKDVVVLCVFRQRRI